MSDFTKALLAFLNEIADEYDLDIQESYRGRGMYGDTCVAIVTPDTFDFWLGVEAVKWCIEKQLPKEYLEYFLIDLANYETDNLGYDTVMYWRHSEGKK